MPGFGPRTSLEHEDLDGGGTVIRVTGELDLAGGARFEREVARVREDGEPLLVDLWDCDFIDSTGLSALVRVARAEGGERVAIVCRPDGAVRRAFRLTRLHDLLPVHESREAALAALAAS